MTATGETRPTASEVVRTIARGKVSAAKMDSRGIAPLAYMYVFFFLSLFSFTNFYIVFT